MREIPKCSRGLGHGYAFLFQSHNPLFYAPAFTIMLDTLPIGLRLYPAITYVRKPFVVLRCKICDDHPQQCR